MKKIMTLAAAMVVAIGMTLAAPAHSEAGPLRDRLFSGGQQGPGLFARLRDRPGLFSGQWEGPGFFSDRGDGGGMFSGYYRVGNVIINGRRWGDLGYRYSHEDLIRW